ncbi:DUF192 domain-containing protein [Marinobacter salinisoli]|uniref:DUF192 domain-containing protein n=1 Tax=Marinobacter salinisoli TaxID=2769486 RepID=A0ABX7MNM1_9GAMM|nr:DUF192 domain-containing protein [Marinobacter salinisoli]QSP93856.1 DUF192 domain-containing protein [Marinobacter salinisoli]
MKKRLRASAACVLLSVSVSGCAANSSTPQAELPIERACFVTDEVRVPVLLEVARKPEQRQTGLMARTSLPADQGMMFVYPSTQQPDRGFWMYNTLLELDIAYLNETGTISAIRRMTPCPPAQGFDCPTYPAGVPFTYAVEMNAGFFEKHGVEVGDKLMVQKNQCNPE